MDPEFSFYKAVFGKIQNLFQLYLLELLRSPYLQYIPGTPEEKTERTCSRNLLEPHFTREIPRDFARGTVFRGCSLG
jgi:hypothetical protein